jgi:hypothetical protein
MEPASFFSVLIGQTRLPKAGALSAAIDHRENPHCDKTSLCRQISAQ